MRKLVLVAILIGVLTYVAVRATAENPHLTFGVIDNISSQN